MPTVIELAEQLRAAIIARDIAALNRLINAYAGIMKGLSGRIEALVLAIDALEGPTAAQVRRLTQYGQLLEDAATQLTNYRGFVQVELSTAAQQAIEAARKDAPRLIGLSAGGREFVGASLRRLPAGAIETLLGFLDTSGPLYARLGALPAVTARSVADAILEGVALGRNPRVIARSINQAFGMGLTDSMRMMRTVQLYSYREASRANYVMNSDVVRGWTWFAKLDSPTTCMSCIAMHGTEHPNEEPLNDHHNGKCLIIPLVGDRPNPITESGPEWFDRQDEATQKAYMGDARYTAWVEGNFTIAEMSGVHEDSVYGPMRVEQSLKQLMALQ